MIHFNLDSINDLDPKFRLNLINSLSGVKSPFLIGTKSNNGMENVAIFGSIVHLGSHPPFFGFVLRPLKEAVRHTYHNIMSTDFFTLNLVSETFVENAHYTSANFPDGISEFETCKLTPEYLNGFFAPFVKESHLKIGLKFVESHLIEANETIFMVGEVKEIFLEDNFLKNNGYIDFSVNQTVGLSGLNSYYQVKKINEFPYARVNSIPLF